MTSFSPCKKIRMRPTIKAQKVTLRTLLATTLSLVLAIVMTMLSGVESAAASDVITQLAFDDGTGVTATDSSGSGNNGTLLGGAAFVPVSADSSSHSAQFNGNNSIVNLGPLDIVGNELSLTAWFNADQFPGVNRDPRIISKADGLSSNSHVFMLSTSRVSDKTRLRGRVRVGGITKTVTATSGDLSTSTWYHAAVTYDGSQVRLYLDGVQVGIGSLSGNVDTAPSISVAVGGQPDQANRIWDGYIDDIRILQKALTSTEVLAIVNGGSSAPVAANDSYTTNNTSTLLIRAAGILGNDTGSSLSAVLLSTTTNGTLALNTDGSFSYQPNNGFTGNDTFLYQATDGQSTSITATVTITVTGSNNSVELIYVSTVGNGSVSDSIGNTVAYRDEDILTFKPSSGEWSMFFDGSDVGISGDIDTFSLNQDSSLLFSLTAPATLAGTGLVDDSDIIRFIPSSTGESTDGTFELYFDGSDVGLTTSTEDISALSVLDNGNIVISTIGNVNVPGVSATDSDLIEFSPTQLGANTSGSWSIYFEGANVELTTSGEDIWAASVNGNNIYLSTYTNFSTSGVSGDGADILLCEATSVGANTSCNYSLFFNGGDNGLTGQLIDGLQVNAGESPPTNNAPLAVNDSYSTTQDTQLNINAIGVLANDSDADNDPITAALITTATNGIVNLNIDGSLTYVPDPDFSGEDSFTYQASDGQATSNVATVSITITAINMTANPIYVSSASNGTVGNMSYNDEDIIVVDASTGQWSMFFDGSDVGITRNINAFSTNTDGSVLMSLVATTNVPGIGSVRDSDIIRFTPTSTGDNTAGSFEMYFDGSDVGLSTSTEDIQAIDLLSNGDIIISTVGNASVPGANADDSDLLLFTPTQLGNDTAGSWTLFFDGSDVNLTTGGEDIWGVSTDGNNIFLSSYTNFSTSNTAGPITGDSADILLCAAAVTGTETACSYSLFWDGGVNGLSGKIIDGIDVGVSPPEGSPVIDVWYGQNQSFGLLGQPQNYINILGNVADPDGIAALTYKLNTDAPKTLSIGSDDKRLWNDGDFNADISISNLQNGVNQIVFTATDAVGNVQTSTVSVNYDGTTSWPANYQIDWAQQTTIQEAIQIVDGNWALTADGARTSQQGYDRLLAVGNIDWTDYEVLVDFTIHSINSDPALFPGVGLIARWTGHTDDPLAGFQPKSGWRPLAAVGWLAYFPPNAPSRMQLSGYQTEKERKNFTYMLGQLYKARFRIETISPSESTYSMKIWNDGDNEPGNWDLVYNDVTSGVQSGSALLVAQQADVTFGDITITPVSSGQRIAASTVNVVNSTDNSDIVSLAALQINPVAQVSTDASVAADTDNPATTDTSQTASQQFTNANLWWNYSWPYRATVKVKSGDFDRTNLIIEKYVNLASLFDLSSDLTLNTDTVRCHEVDTNGAMLTLDIPCQFDPNNSSTAGHLLLMASGTTAAGTQRYFHSYFDQHGGNSVSSPTHAAVNINNVTTDENRTGVEINTPGGRYVYINNAGALSNLLDIDGNDWIGYQGGTQSNKALRGIPNLSPERNYFQPLATTSHTKITRQGPLKTTLESTTADENWKTRWEFYPHHAALTVLAADSKFQFTYTGTPSGIENLNNGDTTKADGSSKPLASNWTEDLISEEWIHLTRNNRSLVLVKTEDDTVAETYSAINPQTAQFQFGMQTPETGGIGSYVWSKYLMSLRETTSFKDIQRWVDSTVEPVEVAISNPAVVQ